MLPMTATPSVAAELAGGVVDRRSDAGLLVGDDAHDRLGRRGGGEAETDAEQRPSDRRSRGRGSRRWRSRPRRTMRRPWQAAGDDDLVADPHRELGRRAIDADGDRERHGQDADAGAQRRVALEELEVLGDQEHEPGQREERDRDRSARRGEAQVAEQATGRASGRAPCAPRRRRRRDDRQRRRSREVRRAVQPRRVPR